MYSSETNKVLISMFNGTSVDISVFSPVVSKQLFNDGYIFYTAPDCHVNTLCLTDAGRAYVENILKMQKQDFYNSLHKWINTIIAFAALIIALFK